MRAVWADLPNLKIAISQNMLNQIACNFIKLTTVKHVKLWCQLKNAVFCRSKMTLQVRGVAIMAFVATMMAALM